MIIVLSGGGTGGHITPLLAVSHKLRERHPNAKIVYLGEKGTKFGDLITEKDFDDIYRISAGKLRRYHKEAWLKRLIDVKTNLQNIRDGFLVVIGIVQAWRLLGQLKPDLIFIKGGYVGLPVGIAARLRKIPFITHDSDVLPGLTNRVIGRWAQAHAVGMPKEHYSYPEAKTFFVGVPVGREYKPVNKAEQNQYKTELGYETSSKLVLVTGGSLGATAINEAVKAMVPELLETQEDTFIVHQTGKGKAGLYANLDPRYKDRVLVTEYLNDLHRYNAAADIVISRAGASAIAGLAVQGKACIFIPNPLLTGGHQTKNAKVLEENKAAVIIDETTLKHRPKMLLNHTLDLLNHADKRKTLEQNLASLAKPDATEQLVTLLEQYLPKQA